MRGNLIRVKRPAPNAFVARLVQLGILYSVEIPASVCKAMGLRGHVPVVATVNDVDDIRATIIPAGRGRYRLFLNGKIRRAAAVEKGERLRASIALDPSPPELEPPEDLDDALREADALDTFRAFPRGKRNHIIDWLASAVADATRAKRVGKIVEVVLAAREKALDRALARDARASQRRA